MKRSNYEMALAILNARWEESDFEEAMTNERKHITQPTDWWKAFEEAAKA